MIAANHVEHQRVAGLLVEEDGGLAALMGSAPAALARDTALGEPVVLQAVKDVLQRAFQDEGRQHYLDPFAPAAARNAEVVAVLRQAIATHQRQAGVLARVPTDDETLLALFAATVGWGPAQRYLDDPRVNEIKIVGRRIRVQESGQPFVTVPEQFASVDEVRERVMLLVAVLGVRLDAEVPQSTLPVAHGTRLHVTIHPRVPRDGILVCIRRGRRTCWDLADVRQRGTVDNALEALLQLFSRARCSFLLAGRTGSGKTALLEALANSWPGEPHIITIEDHTAEIGISRADLWTREHVNTEHDPQAFGRVAKEAMRQTPDLLLPGETRSSEAGAILAMALSDHPVMTTLHARSCREAVERFASFAAMPGAYMYEGRRSDALRDTCVGFDVVVKMDVWEDLGLRLVTEIALLDGSTIERGVTEPVLVPLAKVDVQPDGRITWAVAARPGGDGMLAWEGGQDRTPAVLREKLVRARALGQVRAAVPTLDLVADATERASQHLLAGEADRALATLRSAWAQRRDERLLAAAQQALAHAPNSLARERRAAQELRGAVERLVLAKRWRAAWGQYDELTSDLVYAAAAAPIGGWEAVERVITAGAAYEAEAEAARSEAEAALQQQAPRAAVDILARFALTDLPHPVALALVTTRERAMEQLVTIGQGSGAALATVQAQRAAIERALAAEHAADQQGNQP